MKKKKKKQGEEKCVRESVIKFLCIKKRGWEGDGEGEKLYGWMQFNLKIFILGAKD